MKKKILFVMPHLKTGGVQSAFLNLINEIKDNKNLEIDLFIFDTDDVDILPPEVNVLPVGKLTRLLTTKQKTIESESRILGILRLLLGGVAKFIADHYAYSFVFMFEKILTGYDAAISFSQSGPQHSLYGGMNEFVMTKVEAKKKITVLHCDFSHTRLDTLYNIDLYQMFDKICAVSEGVKKAFLSRVPECSDKVFVMHNCHDFYKMAELSAIETVEYERSVLNILTIGGVTEEKGHLRALDALYRLKEEGLKFCWHIVGDGEDLEKLKQKTEEYNMTRNVIFYGAQKNPYKFYVNADVLFVPSFYEAAPMVFTESEFFNIPIVATKTTSTDEFVTDRNMGIVCENSENGIYKAFEYIFKNPHIIREIKRFDRPMPNNEMALKEFYEVIQGEENE